MFFFNQKWHWSIVYLRIIIIKIINVSFLNVCRWWPFVVAIFSIRFFLFDFSCKIQDCDPFIHSFSIFATTFDHAIHQQWFKFESENEFIIKSFIKCKIEMQIYIEITFFCCCCYCLRKYLSKNVVWWSYKKRLIIIIDKNITGIIIILDHAIQHQQQQRRQLTTHECVCVCVYWQLKNIFYCHSIHHHHHLKSVCFTSVLMISKNQWFDRRRRRWQQQG